MFDKPIVMIDFETTGMSPANGDRITEVAALRIAEGRVVERFVTLVNCGVQVPWFITQLTGITQAMVDEAPHVSTVMPELVDFIGSDPLAAHNAGFDEKFLLAESARCELVPRHENMICSLKLARRLFPGLPSYSLSKLCASLGIRFKGTAHRAEADAEVSAELLLHIGAHLAERSGKAQVEAALLAHINRLNAARVPRYLETAFH